MGASATEFASRGRAVADAARDLATQREANVMVIEAVQRRLVTLDVLRHEVERGPRRGSRQARVALAAAETNAWSLPEFDLVTLAAGSWELPEAWPNPTLTTLTGEPLPTPDLWFDEVGLAVNVHSRRYHERDEDWDGTLMSDTVLGELGVVVLSVTPAVIARDPGETLRRVERAYRSLVGRPGPGSMRLQGRSGPLHDDRTVVAAQLSRSRPADATTSAITSGRGFNPRSGHGGAMFRRGRSRATVGHVSESASEPSARCDAMARDER